MFTKHDQEVAKQIIEGLDLPREFGVQEEDCEFDSDWISYQIGKVYSGDFSIANGVSKMVIIPAREDFVIKVPFNGMFHYEWNDEEEDYDYDNPDFYAFSEAKAPDESDYCWNEVISIEEAAENGFGSLFPKTEFFMEHDGKRYYLQEKVEVSLGYHPSISQHSRATAESMDPYYKCGNNEWRAAIVEIYGEDFWTNFVEWDKLNCMGMLTDMHATNYGYDMLGHPIILDVSGFRD